MPLKANVKARVPNGTTSNAWLSGRGSAREENNKVLFLVDWQLQCTAIEFAGYVLQN